MALRGPFAIAVGIAVMALSLTAEQLGVLTGFGLIALGATMSLSRKRPVVVWLHLCVYLLLYGLLAGAMLNRVDLSTTPLARVLLRLDFAASFILMVAVCRLSLPVLLGGPSRSE
ncbi:MAG: hypothetical protein WD851_21980 [Pirellulales bacterium]